MAISNNNVQNVKFLRNGSLFASRELAKSTLSGFTVDNEKDGTAILARYSGGTFGESSFFIKTLVGFVYANGDNKSVTIFDIDDAGTDAKNYVDSLIGTDFITSGNTVENNLTALSGNSNSVSGDTSVEGAKRYADGLKDGMDYSGLTADDNKVVYNVTEADGIVAAEAKNISSVKLAGYAVGNDAKIAETDTLGEALGKLQGQINGMDLTQVGNGNGKVIIAVSELDGKVSASATSVSDLTLEGFEANTATTGAVTSADTIEAAINKLENKAAAITIANADGSINVTTAATGTDINVNIKSGEKVIAKDGNAGLYTNIGISAATSAELATLGTNVQEAYKLVATDGTRLGEFIKIYKDSSLVNLYLGHVDDLLSGTTAQTEESESSEVVPGSGSEALVWIVQLADGNYKLAAVDVESFLQESEFKNGLQVSNHEVSVKVDSTSEAVTTGESATANVLSVSSEGVKVGNIQAAIDYKVSTLDATVGSQTVASGKHVAVEVSEADGKLTAVTVTESDIASKTDLDTLSGKTVTAVEMTGGTATTASTADGTKKITINADGSSIKMTGYSKGSASGAVESTDSVNAAIGKLENQIAGQIDALDADLSGNSTHVTVGVEEVNGKITAVTVSESNIANADDLTNEIAARKAVDGQSGQTYAVNSSANYISGATSLNDADIKLDAQAKVNADNILKNKVKAGNGIAISGGSSTSEGTTVSAKVKNDGGLAVDSDGLHLGYIDAGIYDAQ